ncbi:MAG: Gfo/Idh/MocA family oxidoreductase [Flavobacteriaceae bacterium]
MKKKIKWGILGTGAIAVEQLIPALVGSSYGEVYAIASRRIEKAQKTAQQFGMTTYYGAYQELLDDTEVEAVYIPLPNHLHVEWAIKALRAGKHVLVEKPIAMSSAQARELVEEAEKHPQLKVMEAFMYKFHPQWIKVKEMIAQGEIGALKTIQASFSFFEDDPDSIVNKKEFGGGSLMDIGCYPISISRFLFDAEPKSVSAVIDYDPLLEVDILATGILEFDQGTTNFFSATQMVDNQQVTLFGTWGSIAFELPFNPPIDTPSKIWLTKDDKKTEVAFEICNQYTLQVDAFSLAIIEDSELPVNLQDAVSNMIVIEKLKESDRLGQRV